MLFLKSLCMRFFVADKIGNLSVLIASNARKNQQFPHEPDTNWSYRVAPSVGGDSVVEGPDRRD